MKDYKQYLRSKSKPIKGSATLEPPAGGQDALQSVASMAVLDLVSEGPIYGLVDAKGRKANNISILESLHLEGTPVLGKNVASPQIRSIDFDQIQMMGRLTSGNIDTAFDNISGQLVAHESANANNPSMSFFKKQEINQDKEALLEFLDENPSLSRFGFAQFKLSGVFPTGDAIYSRVNSTSNNITQVSETEYADSIIGFDVKWTSGYWPHSGAATKDSVNQVLNGSQRWKVTHYDFPDSVYYIEKQYDPLNDVYFWDFGSLQTFAESSTNANDTGLAISGATATSADFPWIGRTSSTWYEFPSDNNQAQDWNEWTVTFLNFHSSTTNVYNVTTFDLDVYNGNDKAKRMITNEGGEAIEVPSPIVYGYQSFNGTVFDYANSPAKQSVNEAGKVGNKYLIDGFAGGGIFFFEIGDNDETVGGNFNTGKFFIQKGSSNTQAAIQSGADNGYDVFIYENSTGPISLESPSPNQLSPIVGEIAGQEIGLGYTSDLNLKYNYGNIDFDFRDGFETQPKMEGHSDGAQDFQIRKKLYGPLSYGGSATAGDGYSDVRGGADFSDWMLNPPLESDSYPYTHTIRRIDVKKCVPTISIEGLSDVIYDGDDAGTQKSEYLRVRYSYGFEDGVTGSVGSLLSGGNGLRDIALGQFLQEDDVGYSGIVVSNYLNTYDTIGDLPKNKVLKNLKIDDTDIPGLTQALINEFGYTSGDYLFPGDDWKIPNRFLKIEKISFETDSTLIQRDCSISYVTEIVGEPFSYPLLGLAGTIFDARNFATQPKREFDIRGKMVAIPSNYEPLNVDGSDKRFINSSAQYGLREIQTFDGSTRANVDQDINLGTSNFEIEARAGFGSVLTDSSTYQYIVENNGANGLSIFQHNNKIKAAINRSTTSSVDFELEVDISNRFNEHIYGDYTYIRTGQNLLRTFDFDGNGYFRLDKSTNEQLDIRFLLIPGEITATQKNEIVWFGGSYGRIEIEIEANGKLEFIQAGKNLIGGTGYTTSSDNAYKFPTGAPTSGSDGNPILSTSLSENKARFPTGTIGTTIPNSAGYDNTVFTQEINDINSQYHVVGNGPIVGFSKQSTRILQPYEAISIQITGSTQDGIKIKDLFDNSTIIDITSSETAAFHNHPQSEMVLNSYYVMGVNAHKTTPVIGEGVFGDFSVQGTGIWGKDPFDVTTTPQVVYNNSQGYQLGSQAEFLTFKELNPPDVYDISLKAVDQKYTLEVKVGDELVGTDTDTMTTARGSVNLNPLSIGAKTNTLSKLTNLSKLSDLKIRKNNQLIHHWDGTIIDTIRRDFCIKDRVGGFHADIVGTPSGDLDDTFLYGRNKARIYNGPWDGTFKLGWTDNPAWILYDLMINPIYGVGNSIDDREDVNIFNLYRIAQYCDAVDEDGYFDGLPDATRGLEPRFSCNLRIHEAKNAFEVIGNMASIFRGFTYWDGVGLNFAVDKEKEISAIFNNGNVHDGLFNYGDVVNSARFTKIEVLYADAKDQYGQKAEYIEDEEGIRKYGLITKILNGIGCTSKSQAKRMGKYVLLSNKMETEIAKFKASSECHFLEPGDIIRIDDELKNFEINYGKILDVYSAGNNPYVLIENNVNPSSIQIGANGGIYLYTARRQNELENIYDIVKYKSVYQFGEDSDVYSGVVNSDYIDQMNLNQIQKIEVTGVQPQENAIKLYLDTGSENIEYLTGVKAGSFFNIELNNNVEQTYKIVKKTQAENNLFDIEAMEYDIQKFQKIEKEDFDDEEITYNIGIPANTINRPLEPTVTYNIFERTDLNYAVTGTITAASNSNETSYRVVLLRSSQAGPYIQKEFLRESNNTTNFEVNGLIDGNYTLSVASLRNPESSNNFTTTFTIDAKKDVYIKPIIRNIEIGHSDSNNYERVSGSGFGSGTSNYEDVEYRFVTVDKKDRVFSLTQLDYTLDAFVEKNGEYVIVAENYEKDIFTFNDIDNAIVFGSYNSGFNMKFDLKKDGTVVDSAFFETNVNLF